MQLFYQPHITQLDNEVNFDKDESRHLIRVLRKTVGDQVFVTDGAGWLYEVQVVVADEKRSKGKIVNQTKYQSPKASLKIGIAPTKLNERFEWFLEKVTEIGINRVSPIICDRSERKVIKLPRMQRIIVSAAKQSLKYNFPQLEEPSSFKQFLQLAQWQEDSQLFIAHCGDGERRSLKTELASGKSAVILIGPEGDFSPEEVGLANTLDAAEARRLADALRSITKKAVDADADADRYPGHWLFHQRWAPAEGLTTPAGDSIEFLTLSGRTTAWVPALQR